MQNDLFSGTQVVERVLEGSGATVRLRLAPLAGRRVRILEYYRRGRGEQRFQRARREEDREVEYARLKLGPDFDELFKTEAAAPD